MVRCRTTNRKLMTHVLSPFLILLLAMTASFAGTDYGTMYLGTQWPSYGNSLALYDGDTAGTIYVGTEGSLSIYGGTVTYHVIVISTSASVTVFGTDFKVDGADLPGTWSPLAQSEWLPMPVDWTDVSGQSKLEWTPGGIETLSVTYFGDTAATALIFNSTYPITLIQVDTSVTPPPGPIEVQIDIKPGDDTNRVNLGSNGVIPVAIFSTEDFDATELDPGSIFLAGSGVRVRGKGNKYLASQEDIDGDGRLDLVVKIETQNLDPDTFQDGGAILKVYSDDDEPKLLYQGWDSLTIVPPQ